jgi:hypothetical protein
MSEMNQAHILQIYFLKTILIFTHLHLGLPSYLFVALKVMKVVIFYKTHNNLRIPKRFRLDFACSVTI